MSYGLADIKTGAHEVFRRVSISRTAVCKTASLLAWGAVTVGAFKSQSLLGVTSLSGAIFLGSTASAGAISTATAIARKFDTLSANVLGAVTGAAYMFVVGGFIYVPYFAPQRADAITPPAASSKMLTLTSPPAYHP